MDRKDIGRLVELECNRDDCNGTTFEYIGSNPPKWSDPHFYNCTECHTTKGQEELLQYIQ